MFRNNLIVLNPKNLVLEKTKPRDLVEIKRKENNTYLVKIIGYNEKEEEKYHGLF